MTTKEFNETLDSFKFNHNGPVLFGHDDYELVKSMAKQALDQDDLLFAIRYLVVSLYLENQ